MRYDFMLEIPMIGEEGDLVGHMFKFVQKKPKHLPRLGEQIYVLPNTYLVVEKISYEGLYLHMVNMRLSPLSYKFRKDLETSLGNRKDAKWTWSE